MSREVCYCDKCGNEVYPIGPTLKLIRAYKRKHQIQNVALRNMLSKRGVAISTASLSAYDKGKRRPSFSTLFEMAKAVGVPDDKFWDALRREANYRIPAKERSQDGNV